MPKGLKGNGPIYFPYVPVKTERTPPERIREWEDRMRELCGVSAKLIVDKGFVETDSYSGAPPQFDD